MSAGRLVLGPSRLAPAGWPSPPAAPPARGLPQPWMARVGDHPTLWELQADYGYGDPVLGRLLVPVGTRWDRASVPRAVRWVVDNDDLREVGPLLHDWLYQRGGRLPDGRQVARAAADALFRRAMLADGVVPWKAQASYVAVRARGGLYWQDSHSPGARVNAALARPSVEPPFEVPS